MRIGSNASWRMYATTIFIAGTSFVVAMGPAPLRQRSPVGAAP